MESAGVDVDLAYFVIDSSSDWKGMLSIVFS